MGGAVQQRADYIAPKEISWQEREEARRLDKEADDALRSMADYAREYNALKENSEWVYK